MKFNFVEGSKIGYYKNKLSFKPPKSRPVRVMIVTCGGGMGGSKWREVVEVEGDIKSNTLQQFTTIEGEKITLNTSYVVKISNYDLVTVFYESNNKKNFLVNSKTDWKVVNGKMEYDADYSKTTWNLEREYRNAPVIFRKGDIVKW